MGPVQNSKISNKLPTGPFIINGLTYSKEELLEYCWSNTLASDISDWERDVYLFISDFLDPKVELIQKTSGTTGDPKSFVLDRKAMIRSAWNTISFFNLSPGSTVLLCLPVRYIAGRMMVVRALVGSLDLRISEPTSQPRISEGQAYDFAAMVPLQVYNLLSTERHFQIGKLIIGGGEMSPELRERLEKREKGEVYETFGMSETYTHFAVRRVNGPDASRHFQALPGVQIASDNRNCLLVSIEEVSKGVIQTNDLVEIVNEQSFLWLGRFDNVINSGGIKIIPEILEARIRKITGREAVLLALSDAGLGQKMVLVLEGKDRGKEEFWKKKLGNIFQKHELPKHIYYIDRLPRTESMKVDRKLLPAVLPRYSG